MTQESDSPADETTSDSEPLSLEFGQTLYTEDGRPVGIIHGIDESRVVVVSIGDDVEVTDLERHYRSGQSFGEAELMWRCTNCGEMGEIEDGLPETCPTCGTEKEDLMYWTED